MIKSSDVIKAEQLEKKTDITLGSLKSIVACFSDFAAISLYLYNHHLAKIFHSIIQQWPLLSLTTIYGFNLFSKLSINVNSIDDLQNINPQKIYFLPL